MKRVDVEVLARYNTEGKIYPISVTWEDGRTFEIDQILDIRPAASLKVGGAGIRYQVRIGRSVTYLFLEQNQWFVEGKDSVQII